jgi:hypothetical protein
MWWSPNSDAFQPLKEWNAIGTGNLDVFLRCLPARDWTTMARSAFFVEVARVDVTCTTGFYFGEAGLPAYCRHSSVDQNATIASGRT